MPQISDWGYLIRTLSEKFVPKIAQRGKQDNVITNLLSIDSLQCTTNNRQHPRRKLLVLIFRSPIPPHEKK